MIPENQRRKTNFSAKRIAEDLENDSFAIVIKPARNSEGIPEKGIQISREDSEKRPTRKPKLQPRIKRKSILRRRWKGAIFCILAIIVIFGFGIFGIILDLLVVGILAIIRVFKVRKSDGHQ